MIRKPRVKRNTTISQRGDNRISDNNGDSPEPLITSNPAPITVSLPVPDMQTMPVGNGSGEDTSRKIRKHNSIEGGMQLPPELRAANTTDNEQSLQVVQQNTVVNGNNNSKTNVAMANSVNDFGPNAMPKNVVSTDNILNTTSAPKNLNNNASASVHDIPPVGDEAAQAAIAENVRTLLSRPKSSGHTPNTPRTQSAKKTPSGFRVYYPTPSCLPVSDRDVIQHQRPGSMFSDNKLCASLNRPVCETPLDPDAADIAMLAKTAKTYVGGDGADVNCPIVYGNSTEKWPASNVFAHASDISSMRVIDNSNSSKHTNVARTTEVVVDDDAQCNNRAKYLAPRNTELSVHGVPDSIYELVLFIPGASAEDIRTALMYCGMNTQYMARTAFTDFDKLTPSDKGDGAMVMKVDKPGQQLERLTTAVRTQFMKVATAVKLHLPFVTTDNLKCVIFVPWFCQDDDPNSTGDGNTDLVEIDDHSDKLLIPGWSVMVGHDPRSRATQKEWIEYIAHSLSPDHCECARRVFSLRKDMQDALMPCKLPFDGYANRNLIVPDFDWISKVWLFGAWYTSQTAICIEKKQTLGAFLYHQLESERVICTMARQMNQHFVTAFTKVALYRHYLGQDMPDMVARREVQKEAHRRTRRARDIARGDQSAAVSHVAQPAPSVVSPPPPGLSMPPPAVPDPKNNNSQGGPVQQ